MYGVSKVKKFFCNIFLNAAIKKQLRYIKLPVIRNKTLNLLLMATVNVV